MLICRWAKSREAAAVSAFFVLTVSCAGLAGRVARKEPIPVIAVGLAVSAVVGGALGSRLGSTRLSPRWIHILLATALIVAGIKLLIIVKPKEPLPQLPKSSVTAEVGPGSR